MSKNTQQEISVNPLELGAEELLLQESLSYWQNIWTEVKKRPSAVVAIWVLIILALIAIAAPLLANHRPYITITPITGDDGTVTKEIAFPLFKAMTIIDWTLLSGSISLVWLFLQRKYILRAKGKANKLLLLLFLAFSILPIVWGLFAVPWSQKELIPATWWWLIFTILTFFGIAGLIYGTSIVATGRRDEFGRDLTGIALRSLFTGSLLLVICGSAFGTMNRPKLDRTDYYSEYVIDKDEGSWALFAPIPHNYIASENYARNLQPLSPKLRVMPSGGSNAANDLCLEERQIVEGQHLSDGYNGKFSVTTPLADLNGGKGVTLHQRGSNDLIIITNDLKPTRVKLKGAQTLGDIVDLMNKQAIDRKTKQPKYEVSINPDTGLIFKDLTMSRPIHWFGTEDSGADLASRLIMATRVALSIGFVSTGIAVIIGVIFGAIIGYFGGWVDYIGMRIIEIFMAIPRLFLLLTIIAFLPPQWGPYMLYAMMIVIGLTSWMTSARFIRAEFFRLRETDYVQAAKACGLPLRSILFKHMLPNGVTPVLVSASFGIAAAIFIETGLSFLGFGIKPPNPSWGQMLNEAIDQSTGVFRWWLAIFPGIMIFLTVFSFNLIGDALRDAIDPKLKKASAV